ncbi:MAG: hypothetical protein AAF618_10505 [Pseudomonadota bacterium]
MRGLSLLFLLFPLAAQAEEHVLPAGCTAYVSIQYKLCVVSHHYTCSGDADGIQHRVDIDEDGPFFTSSIDFQTQWIESHDLRRDEIDRLDAGAADAANFTELARTGRDDLDFSTTSDRGETIRYRGRDLLTGKTVVIDDVPLLETDTFMRATRADGSLAWESAGNEYIHLDWRIFIAGRSVTRTDGGTFEDDDAPLRFDFPGDPGFLASEPAFNCSPLLL